MIHTNFLQIQDLEVENLIKVDRAVENSNQNVSIIDITKTTKNLDKEEINKLIISELNPSIELKSIKNSSKLGSSISENTGMDIKNENFCKKNENSCNKKWEFCNENIVYL